MSDKAMHAAYDFYRARSRTVGEVTAFAEAVNRYNDAVYREQASSLVPAEQKARSREQMSQDMKRYWRRKKGLAA